MFSDPTQIRGLVVLAFATYGDDGETQGQRIVHRHEFEIGNNQEVY